MSDTESVSSSGGADAGVEGLDDFDSDFDEEIKSSQKKRKAPAAKAKESPAKSAKKKETDTAPKKPARKAAPKKKVDSESDDDLDDDVPAKPAAKKSAVNDSKASKGGAKVKELSEKEGYGVIQKYINEQNKPFSAVTIFENLHKTIKKAHVVRICAQLAQDGKIIEKEFGKCKIYYADQSQFPSVSEKELQEMGDEIDELNERSKELATEVTTLKSELKSLETAMSDAELKKSNEQMIKMVAEYEIRLKALAGAEKIDPKEFQLLQTEIGRLNKIWKDRRVQCKEKISMLADGLEKDDAEIEEAAGIETEEQLGLPLSYKL